MPVMETDNLTQKAVLWAASGSNDSYARPKVDAGVEISVRWEDGRGEVVDSKGNVVAYDATVTVDRRITVGSIMWLGELADYASTVTKLRVVSFSEVPDVKGQNYWRKVLLARSSDELPDLA